MNQSCSVVIASINRPESLREMLLSLSQQTLKPVEVCVSVTKPEDFPDAIEDFLQDFSIVVRRIISSPGASRQRNVGFQSLTTKTEIVIFLDDDMVLHRDYILNLSAMFAERPNCVCMMGHLLANGNVSLEEAKLLCSSPPDLGKNARQYYATSHLWGGLYGCNMSFRWSFLEKELFDERLPFYSEMEDVDMGSRARNYGEVGYYFGSLAIHLQLSSGRINYKMRGFSQVMNPYYLSLKGSIPRRHALTQFVLRMPFQNACLAVLPGQQSKRFQLLLGNLYALLNIVQGKVEPELISRLR